MIGVGEIMEIIPHRYPILLVDRVVDIEVDRRITALKAVTANEPCYRSVSDSSTLSSYAYPVPLLVESWAQAAVLLAVWQQPNPDVVAGKVELAGAIKNVSIGDPVLPGDVLEHRARIVRSVGDTILLEGETVVGSTTVLTVESLVLAMRDLRDLPRRPNIDAFLGVRGANR